MKERPILFSGEMVRKLLAGAKTQTRRVMRVQPRDWAPNPSFLTVDGEEPITLSQLEARCPHGVPGDRLWVKETFYCDHVFVKDYELTTNCGRVGPRVEPDRAKCEAEWRELIWYEADAPISTGYWAERTPPLTPSLFMPRWASRITLEITSVKVERVQDISEEDAIAEGIEPVEPVAGWSVFREDGGSYWTGQSEEPMRGVDGVRDFVRGKPLFGRTAGEQYAALWDTLNGKRAGCTWADNPWVWCLSFRVLPPTEGEARS